MQALAVTSVITAALFAGAALAADTYPDLRGTWTGTGDGVFVPAPGAKTDDQFGSVGITVVIDAQKDRRFAGTITMQENVKPIVGVISTSDTIWWSEPGGFVEGRLIDADTFEGCYVRVSQFSQLAACEVLKRQK